MNREALESLAKETLIRLVLVQAQTISALTRQIEFLTAPVGELEAKLGLSPKMPVIRARPRAKGKGLGLGGEKARAQDACRGAPASAS
jgi:hypothetical protein